MCNLLKPTVDHMVFCQYRTPDAGRAHRSHSVLLEGTPRPDHAIPAVSRLTILVPLLTVMAVVFAAGYMAAALLELVGLDFRQALKPLSGVSEFLNADALGRTLKAQTASFARAAMRLPI